MRFSFVVFLLILSYHSDAILPSRIDRQILLQVKPENSNESYLKKLFPNEQISLSVAGFHIWMVEFKDSIPNVYIQKLKSEGKISNPTKNRLLAPRATTPNDSLFSQQWHHYNFTNPGQNVPYGINSIGAWDFDKGITTAKGDTIVVAVCESGFDSFHQDLDYFVNYNEIPNDSIDNDLNGAIDDYRGWNITLNSGSLVGDELPHTMKVCGGIAAKGNNKMGVTGVAWNSKILPVNFGTVKSIENAIKAYEYCLNMKRIYRQSNKQKGAYIVAVNFSFGGTGFLPEDEPLWCAAIDSLGKEGIFLVVAVDDNFSDVESYQDMPVLCNSPYQINVSLYEKVNLSIDGHGYSKKIVHLAAPDRYMTTIQNNSYANSGYGSSFAAPLVSGTIALMYSNMCEKFLDTLYKNPSIISKKLKDIILNEVDKTPMLTDKVVSNGKLNVYKTIMKTRQWNDSFCKDTTPNNIETLQPNKDILIYNYHKNLVIKKSIPIPLSITMYNMFGQAVLKKDIIENEMQMDLSQFPNAVYYLVYQSQSEIYSIKMDIR